MKKIIPFIFIAILFALNSCGPNYDIDGTAPVKNLKIGGQVVDLNGNPIQGVTVKVGNKTLVTDANGFFYTPASFTTKSYLIKFSKNGYLPNLRSGLINNKSEIKVKVALISNSDASYATINTQTGGQLTISTPYGNAEIVFPQSVEYKIKATGEKIEIK